MWRNALAGALAACALMAGPGAHAQSALVGAWTYADPEGTHPDTFATMTLYADGQYIYSQVAPLDPSNPGHSGVERGFYSWDPVTHRITADVRLDTNGEWGLSHPRGEDLMWRMGNQLVGTETGPGGEDFAFDLVVQPGLPIVNGWTTAGYPDADDLLSLWFLADGNYLLASAGPGTFRYGTYAWDSLTGALNATAGGGDFSSFSLLSGAVSGSSLLLHTSAGDFNLVAANVPEPETYSLLAAGLLAFFARRRKARSPRPSES